MIKRLIQWFLNLFSKKVEPEETEVTLSPYNRHPDLVEKKPPHELPPTDLKEIALKKYRKKRKHKNRISRHSRKTK